VSAHAALVFALGLAALCVLGATVFLAWLVGALALDLYRHVTGQYLRLPYRRSRFEVGSDARRDRWLS
jgi:hypothetical protein